MSMCVTCRPEDRDEFIPRISKGEECEECGRRFCFEKVKVTAIVKNESGNTRRMTKMIDYQGDTPMDAINSVLEDFNGPRGERVVRIDKIKVNTTPPLRKEEMGERRVQYEEAGVLVHDITLGVQR